MSENQFISGSMEGVDEAPKLFPQTTTEKKVGTTSQLGLPMSPSDRGELALTTLVKPAERIDTKRIFKQVQYGSLIEGAIYSREYKKDHFMVETRGKEPFYKDEFLVWIFEEVAA